MPAQGALAAMSASPSALLSIILLAFNEEENLPIQAAACLSWLDHLATHPAGVWPELAAAALPPDALAGELIIVDDGSTDGTAAIADALAQGDARVRVVHHAQNRGMGATVRSGYAAARGLFVTQLPADCQVAPTTLERFLPHLDEVDAVFSVYRQRDDGVKRSLMSRGFQLLVRLFYGQDARLTGTMVLRRTLVARHPTVANTFFANLELPFRILQAGHPSRVVEIEAVPRRAGRSKVANPRRIARVVAEMVRIRATAWPHAPKS